MAGSQFEGLRKSIVDMLNCSSSEPAAWLVACEHVGLLGVATLQTAIEIRELPNGDSRDSAIASLAFAVISVDESNQMLKVPAIRQRLAEFGRLHESPVEIGDWHGRSYADIATRIVQRWHRTIASMFLNGRAVFNPDCDCRLPVDEIVAAWPSPALHLSRLPPIDTERLMDFTSKERDKLRALEAGSKAGNKPPSRDGARSPRVKRVIRCYQRGMSNRQDIASECNEDVDYVSQIKRRYTHECRPQDNKPHKKTD